MRSWCARRANREGAHQSIVRRSAIWVGDGGSDENRLPAAAAGRFTFPGTSISVNRMAYGAMQLAGPHAFAPAAARRSAPKLVGQHAGPCLAGAHAEGRKRA